MHRCLSLSDCLIAKKIPFYELRPHKIASWQSFDAVARYLDLIQVQQYLQIVAESADSVDAPEQIADRLCQVLCHKDFKAQWQSLLEFINKHYCFEDALVSHVNRHLCISDHPELKDKEEEIIDGYLEGEISATQSYAAMQKAIYKMQ